MLGSGNSPAQASLSALDLRKLHTLLIRLADTSDLQSARYAALALASYVEQVQADIQASACRHKLPQPLSEEALRDKDLKHNKAHRVVARLVSAGTDYVLDGDVSKKQVETDLLKLLDDVLGRRLELNVTMSQMVQWFQVVNHQYYLPSQAFLTILAEKGIKQWPPGKRKLPECQTYKKSLRKKPHTETDLASMPSPSHSLPSEAVSSVEGSEAEACTALMDMYQCTLHDPAPEYLQSLKTLFGQDEEQTSCA